MLAPCEGGGREGAGFEERRVVSAFSFSAAGGKKEEGTALPPRRGQKKKPV